MASEKLETREEEAVNVEIVRPRRAHVSEDDAVKRMEEFAEQRKEKLIATVRKDKS